MSRAASYPPRCRCSSCRTVRLRGHVGSVTLLDLDSMRRRRRGLSARMLALTQLYAGSP